MLKSIIWDNQQIKSSTIKAEYTICVSVSLSICVVMSREWRECSKRISGLPVLGVCLYSPLAQGYCVQSAGWDLCCARKRTWGREMRSSSVVFVFVSVSCVSVWCMVDSHIDLWMSTWKRMQNFFVSKVMGALWAKNSTLCKWCNLNILQLNYFCKNDCVLLVYTIYKRSLCLM